MTFRLHATRETLKLGLIVGGLFGVFVSAFTTLAGARDRPMAHLEGVASVRPAVLALVAPPQVAAATGTVDLPPNAAGEPGRARLASTEYDYGRAHRMNAALPFSKAPLLSAAAFHVTGDAGDQARALTCMTQAIYYEAGFEPQQGQRAVAQVVLNRMRHPLFPHSVCGVVFQGAVTPGGGCQFSFTCDGSLARGVPAAAAWRRAQDTARAALNGYVEPTVGLATHYHADYVAPYWMTTVTKLARIGQHIFYRWPGTLGLPAAFGERYAAAERIPSTQQLLLAAAAHAKTVPGLPAFRPGAGVTLGPDGAIYVAQADGAPGADGRVHSRLMTDGGVEVTAEPATPQARRAALLAGRAVAPSGLDTLAPPAAQAATPAATPAATAPGASPVAAEN